MLVSNLKSGNYENVISEILLPASSYSRIPACLVPTRLLNIPVIPRQYFLEALKMNVKGYYNRGRVFGYLLIAAAVGFALYYLYTVATI